MASYGRQVLVIYRQFEEVVPYRDAVLAARLAPVVVEAGRELSLGEYHGLLLTGGTDVDPALYGEIPQPETEEPDRERDEFECALLHQALARDLPVLAICRGLQLMNVAMGGTLIQHLQPPDRHRRKQANRGAPVHAVQVQPGTLLEAATGLAELAVNSRHHQAVKTIGRNLRVSGVDPEDGIVEALECPDHRFALAVQWHPENQVTSDAAQLRIFQSFGAAVNG